MDMGTRRWTGEPTILFVYSRLEAEAVAVLAMQLSLSPCSGVQASMVAAVALGKSENSSVSQHRRVDESQWPVGCAETPEG